MTIIVLLALLGALAATAAVLYAPDRPRAVLEARWAPPPSTFPTIAGLRLHLRDTGPRQAPAVILLHGFAASLHTWDAWAAMLEHETRVIRLDLPGFALTGPDPSGDYADERTVAVLLAVMDHLGLARATLVGNSMGGRFAWRFAAAHPERVERLVLMAPDGFASPGLAYGRAPAVPLLMRVLPFVLPTPLLRASLRPAYADPAVLTDTMVAGYRDMLLAPGVRQAIIDRMRQTVLVPPEPLLARITAPTLLLWGEKDAMVPITNARDYLRALPHAELAAMPGVGHLPQEEAPARSLDLLRAFLARPAFLAPPASLEP